MSTTDTAVWALLAVVVAVVLVMAGYGLRDVRARRRAWEEYERGRGR